MKGRIKRGEGVLVGSSGEYYVMAELLKQGVTAALTPRNAPAFDILATKRGKTAKIRVKTKSEQYTDWQWVVKKDGSIFRQLSRRADFVVLVNLKTRLERPDFYIAPTHQVNKWLRGDFRKWLRTPGKNGRQHDPTNTKRHLAYPQHAKSLQKDHKDRWTMIFKQNRNATN